MANNNNHRRQAQGSLLLPFVGNASEGFKQNITGGMNQGARCYRYLNGCHNTEVRRDRRFLQHGHLPGACEKHGNSYCRQVSVDNLATCIVPEHFKDIVMAVSVLLNISVSLSVSVNEIISISVSVSISVNEYITGKQCISQL